MTVRLVAQDIHTTVQLNNGQYRSTGDPASADYADVKLLPEHFAFGDLNGDGVADAAVLLAENYGGSGVFVSLLAVLNVGGQPVQAGAQMIDDRPKIQGLHIDGREIVLEADIHGPNDPGCCAAFAVSQTYMLTKSGLALVRLASTTPAGNRRAITILSPGNGDETSAGVIQVRGSFTTWPFEGTLRYRATDAMDNELAVGPIAVSGEPGSAGVFESTVDLGGIPAGMLVRLEIADISAADGSLLAMDSIELMIK